MARKKKRNANGQRDHNSIANSLLTYTRNYVLSHEDRRLFHPLDDVRPAKGLSKFASQITVTPYKRNRVRPKAAPTPDVFRFNAPVKVAVCVRRKTRREVLFALKRTGKGSRRRRRRRNYYSEVSCAR